MKRKIFAAVAILAVALFAGCTMDPVSARNTWPSGEKYRILGRVTLVTDERQSGYTKLLAAAQEKYPDCDDIVNIMVDLKVGGSRELVMTAIAVDYLEM